MKEETLIRKLGESFYEKWQEQIANEVATARSAIIDVLKEKGTSLPGAVFALKLVEMELVRSQLEEFLGYVKLTKELPLSEKKPTHLEKKET